MRLVEVPTVGGNLRQIDDPATGADPGGDQPDRLVEPHQPADALRAEAHLPGEQGVQLTPAEQDVPGQGVDSAASAITGHPGPGFGDLRAHPLLILGGGDPAPQVFAEQHEPLIPARCLGEPHPQSLGFGAEHT